MASHDTLANMTRRNISDYIVKTNKAFYKKRYGGFEFGVHNNFKDLNNTVIKRNLALIFEKFPLPGSEFGSADFAAEYVTGLLDDLTKRKIDNIKVWFNNKGWTTSVGYLNAINNIILRASIKMKNDDFDDIFDDWKKSDAVDPSQYGISVINHPMNFTEKQLNAKNIRLIGVSLLHAICVIFAMSFVPASFVVFLIEERISKVKHLHFVSSVPPITYWVSAVLWDMLMYLITSIICVVIFIIFDAEAYVSEQSLPALLVIMFLYGVATIPLMYPASFVFNIPSVAFVLLACANLFIGIITTITVAVLENFDDQELKDIGMILKDVFLIFPQYCLGRGLMELAAEYNKNIIANRFGFESTRSNRFEFDFTGKYMLCMLGQGVFFFTLTLLIQYRVFLRLQQMIIRLIFGPEKLDSGINDGSEEDVDVKHEKERVLQGGQNLKDVLLVTDLSKKYSRKGKLAVDHLSFGVKSGECFGLLGVNGAGKTSTFKMLTGDTDTSGGTAFVNGFNIKTNLDEARRNIGYCPQFDALDPLLTGREHLRLYARLRGLSETSVQKYTEWCLRRLGLIPYADRAAGTYSGGNKRKLSTAIALIGKPSMVFLDEPTSGMDPGARRFLWNCVLEMVRGGQSVVLTSHSMEECEALCTRLAIMVNGSFKCHGSIQHLKNRFGSGYTLTVRCMGENTQALTNFVQEQISDAILKDSQLNQLQFHLPLKTTKLPSIFSLMESARTKENLQLEDYSISQMTLDEVFIHFASKQTEETESVET